VIAPSVCGGSFFFDFLSLRSVKIRIRYAAPYLPTSAIQQEEPFMHMHNLNLLAILVAAISTMLVGFIWYSPILFAKPWMREMGYDPNDKASAEKMRKSAGPAYFGSLIASLVSAFVLALFLHEMHVQSLEIGLLVGSHVWLGFVATVQLTSALFTKQSMKLFAINTGYQLVCYLVMSAILTVWR
jgi:Protein of unknown function (DUF1761)